MSRHCAMLVSSSQAGPVIPAAGEDGKGSAEDRLRADLARRVVAGPGLWTDWLEDIDRRGLIEELPADGVIEEAAASAPHDHQLDRALNAKMTVICQWSPGNFVDISIMLLLVSNCQIGARNPLGLSCRADVVSGRDCNIARCSRTRRS